MAWSTGTNIVTYGSPNPRIFTAFSSNRSHGYQHRQKLCHGCDHLSAAQDQMSPWPQIASRPPTSACSSPPSPLQIPLSPQDMNLSTSVSLPSPSIHFLTIMASNHTVPDRPLASSSPSRLNYPGVTHVSPFLPNDSLTSLVSTWSIVIRKASANRLRDPQPNPR